MSAARLFVALEPPAEVRAALGAWTPRTDGLRPVAAEALHLTLAFLGPRGEDEVAAVGALLAPLARPAPRLVLGDARWLPRPAAARVLAVEVGDPSGALAALQAEVAAALEAGAGWRRERRPFLAHVTVARVRRREVPELGGPPPALAFAGETLTLFRSRPSPGGVRYVAETRVPLV